MELRDYQRDAVNAVRNAFISGARRVCLCLPTGAGKSAIAAEIMRSVYANGKRVWFCVPRLELIKQARETLVSFGVPHGEISASKREGWQRICVVSRDTVIRRLSAYPPPDLIFFDEAHVALEQQRRISFFFHDVPVIGMTATPERGDGGPMKYVETAGGSAGLYETLVQVESIPGLQARGVLSGLDYYGLDLRGIETLNLGNRPEAGDDLDKILVYGDIAEYYGRLDRGRQAIGFAPTIRIAEKCVDILNAAGFSFRLIHGGMAVSERAKLIAALKSGRVNGLVNAALLTYGFDAPVVGYAFSVRYIRSRPLWVQMVGRVIRGHPGKNAAVFVDHTGTVNNFLEDGKGGHYIQNGYAHIFEDPAPAWDFAGKKITRCLFADDFVCVRKSKRKTPRCVFDREKLCGSPLYWLSETCVSRLSTWCPKDIPNREYAAKTDIAAESAELVKLSKGTLYRAAAAAAGVWESLSAGEKKEKIRELDAGAVEMGYSPLWTYWQINEGRGVVDTFTLRELAKLRGYKNGWAWHKENEIRDRVLAERKLAETTA